MLHLQSVEHFPSYSVIFHTFLSVKSPILMNTPNNTFDWKNLSPMELVQYLVTEAATDPAYASSGTNKCMEFLMSPTEPSISTVTTSWTDSMLSHDSHHEKESSEDEYTISSDPMKEDKQLSGKKRVKKIPMTAVDTSASTTKLMDYSKKDFAEVMNHWLRENWTNPYPDDEGLTQIANSCGCTPSVVSNWLINARTRKWRPAIVKAFENGRPASLLHEDSMNIFDGKPLRDI